MSHPISGSAIMIEGVDRIGYAKWHAHVHDVPLYRANVKLKKKSTHACMPRRACRNIL